jgi:hypothetical protein
MRPTDTPRAQDIAKVDEFFGQAWGALVAE